jgi:hypothetical protein
MPGATPYADEQKPLSNLRRRAGVSPAPDRGALRMRRRGALLIDRYKHHGPRTEAARAEADQTRVPSGPGYLSVVGGLLMITSTRRFCCRPAAESLLATGSLAPPPEAESRRALIPCPVRYDFTEAARRSESPGR